jgi:uncharacterized LabA/DUF88 family protein
MFINVHRGLPSQKFDQSGYAANRRQSAAWMREGPQIVFPKLRPLRYSRDGEAREKGVDVQLAVEALEWIISEACDVAVIFSHDSDLVPIVEAAVRLKGSECVETASWVADGFHQRIRTRPAVYHHGISEAVFAKVETRTNYAYSERR